MSVSERITNILSYYSGNSGCDPNMYEFVEVCYDMVQYLKKEAPDYGIHARAQVTNADGEVITEAISKEQRREQYPVPCAVFDKFQILDDQFREKLLGNNLGVTEESPLYQLYEQVSRGAGTYSAYRRHPETELYAKLGAVSLFIAQQQRSNPEFRYDDEAEMAYIQELASQCPNLLQTGEYRSKPVDAEEWTVHPSESTFAQHLLDGMAKGKSM